MSADEVTDALDRNVIEALGIRYRADLPGVSADHKMLLASLQHTRRSLDRVEELLGQAMRLRAATHRIATHAGNEFDDAWDRAAITRKNAPVIHGGEFSSARERTAEANLATLDLRDTHRNAADLANRCDEAVDLIRLAHRGLEGLRQDHLAILRTLQFESSLDR